MDYNDRIESLRLSKEVISFMISHTWMTMVMLTHVNLYDVICNMTMDFILNLPGC